MNLINEDKKAETLISKWARLGVAMTVSPSLSSNEVKSRKPPDLERTIAQTAQLCHTNARLFILTISWISQNSVYIARHRLKRMATELDTRSSAVLGLILEESIKQGAQKNLSFIYKDCVPFANAEPLLKVDQTEPFATLVKENATELSKRWGLWVQPIEVKRDALRPIRWILKNNQSFKSRAIRQGDLRCSILESLRLDVSGEVNLSELAQLCAATKPAIRASLESLEYEGVSLEIVSESAREKAYRLTA